MKASTQEHKQARLKQFLKLLSEDPYLLNQDGLEEMRSLSELLLLTGYHPKNEPINLAKLVSLLLEKTGFKVDSEGMMEHIMNGGTLNGFMSMDHDALQQLDSPIGKAWPHGREMNRINQ